MALEISSRLIGNLRCYVLDSIYKGCKQENSRTENTYFNAVSIVIGSIQFGKYKHIKITLFTIGIYH